MSYGNQFFQLGLLGTCLICLLLKALLTISLQTAAILFILDAANPHTGKSADLIAFDCLLF